MVKPFKIESSNVKLLSDIQLTQLLKELLHSEAFSFGISQRSVDVALNINVGDGGEDGRISWVDGPAETDYLPARLTMFQNKATKMSSAKYASEIMTRAHPKSPRKLKPKVEEVLSQGGVYIVFTTQELNTLQKEERITAIRDQLRSLKKSYADTCALDIYDASKIAGWANKFVSTIVSIQHWIGRPTERGLKTYRLWSEHEELSRLPFVSVESRKEVVAALAEGVSKPRSCFRIVGLSGLGKTRTAFQVFVENEVIRNLVIYVDANLAPEIDGLVADWVTLGFEAILVVDNCEYRLHERLSKEVRRAQSSLSLLTMDYDLEISSSQTVRFRLEALSDEETLQLLNPVYKEQLPDLERIAKFAQGYPQMAVLLAEARLAEDPRIGELTDDELANKLLWRRGVPEDPDSLKILQACSLFDVFGVEKEVEPQLEYVSNLVGVSVDTAYACIQEYSERGLIDRRGRFGQVVPKPLAIRLAGQWWTRARNATRRDLVDSIPDGMVEGFCLQVEKLDFHTDVRSLTEDLCGPTGPFGQAEVILSERGSRFFRSFVNVNPTATSTALYQSLANLGDLEIRNIEGEARRNLVWGLERLCYHAGLFSDAAWCMLLLASYENESWGNNATGMFSQLFRIQHSGTAAEPDARFALLKSVFAENKVEQDLVLLEALESAVSIRGGSRAVGAEYQGSKAPLEEWHPKIWQEIFDYWQEAFDLLLLLFERVGPQREQALQIVGHSIRGLVNRGRLDMLDAAIKLIVSVNGPYWPSALDSIKTTFEYDADGLDEKALQTLNSWLDLLTPTEANLSEKLKILVIDPPWEDHKDENGHFIDVAADNAKALAIEVAKDAEALLPYLDLLLQGEQKQSYWFGFQLCLEVQDASILLERALKALPPGESANPAFVLGMFLGLFDKSQPLWQEWVDRIRDNEQLVSLYPRIIRTGKVQPSHLESLLHLIELEQLRPVAAGSLSYGRVMDELPAGQVAEFCLGLANFGDEGRWTALDLIYMYRFGHKGVLGNIREPVKVLLTTVPLHKLNSAVRVDGHKWFKLSEKLLAETDRDLAVALAKQLVAACDYELEYSDLWNYFKPLLARIMREYGDILWPVFRSAIVDSEGSRRYWLQQLLARDENFSNSTPSVLSIVPVDSVIDWCRNNPEHGPVFVAGSVNVFDRTEETQKPSNLFVALLENFGDDAQVSSLLSANLISRGWSGSLVPYLEADKASFSPLLHHQSNSVRLWIQKQIGEIDQRIEFESSRDDERDLGIY